MKKKTLIFTMLLAALFIPQCGYLVDENDAVNAAKNSGIKEPRIIEECRFSPIIMCGCSRNDAAGFKMNGKNAEGKHLSATICVGWPFKGATVRYN